MNPVPIVIHVNGRPAPQGSKRHVGGNRLIEMSKYLPAWRTAVTHAATATLAGTGHVPWTEPVRFEATFRILRPKTRARYAEQWVVTTPDLSKLVRSTEDALTDAQVWADDRYVASIHATKIYVDTQPGARLVITPLRPQGEH